MYFCCIACAGVIIYIGQTIVIMVARTSVTKNWMSYKPAEFTLKCVVYETLKWSLIVSSGYENGMKAVETQNHPLTQITLAVHSWWVVLWFHWWTNDA
jgi:hypothetical protein